MYIRTNKAESIKKLKNHLESEQKKDNLLIIGDFNLIIDEQDRSLPYANDPGLTIK